MTSPEIEIVTEAEIHRDETDEGQSSDHESVGEENAMEKVKEIKLMRKRRAKITRTINSIKESINTKQLTVRRSTKVLSDLRKDFDMVLEIHSELYDFDGGGDTSRLDKWESELTREVYSIEEKVEDYCALVDRRPGKVQTRSESKRQLHAASIEEKVPAHGDENVSLTDSNDSRNNDSAPVAISDEGQGTSVQQTSTEKTEEKTSSEDDRHSSNPVCAFITVDSWIDELTEFTETQLVETNQYEEMSIANALYRIEARKEVPPVQIRKFDGNPLYYVEFIEGFKIHIHDKPHFSDNQRMGQLKMLLAGNAGLSIHGLGSSGIMYASALKCIKRDYGQRSVIAITFIERLTKGEQIRGDRHALRAFSMDIVNCIATLKRLNYMSDVNSTDSLRRIVNRLPFHMIQQWKSKSTEIRDRDQSPTLEHINEFLQRRVRTEFDPDFGDLTRELGGGNFKNRDFQTRDRQDNRKGVHSTQRQFYDNSRPKCYRCGAAHRITDCQKFIDLSHQEKIGCAMENGLCFSCLFRGHTTANCRSKKACGTDGCLRTHHPLLHTSPPSASGAQSILDRESILPVVRVKFRAPNGRVREGNVLIDGGAGTTIIRREFAEMLGLQGKRESLNILVVGGDNRRQSDSRRLKFWISAIEGGEEFQIEAHDMDKTVNSVPALDRKWLTSFRHLQDIEPAHKKGPVDLILGVQYSHLHAEQAVREGLPFEPVAKRTRLGWVVLGSECHKSGVQVTTSVGSCQVLDIDVQRMYELETLGVQAADCDCPKMSTEDKRVLELFEVSCKLENNRYTVGLPWSRDPKELPNNYLYAEKRLESLERSLNRNPEKREMYCKVMTDYVKNGWAEKTEEVRDNVYYLPHHGVVRIDKPSTPLRIVFDPASTYQGVSLNSFLHKGPSTLGDLFGILIRFREEPVAFVGDISKMFLQISLPEEDTHFHRYLWRDMDFSQEPTVYKLLRVTFEDKPSPEMANFVMRKIAQANQEEFPDAAVVIQRDRYMDDLIHSCASEETAEGMMRDLDHVLRTGSFTIKEWICTKDRFSDVKVDLSGEERVKILGVSWCNETDTIHFNVKPCREESYTKRSVLSKLSMLFDPLGLASVVTVKARVAMQEIWKLKYLSWDDPLPDDMCRQWSDIFMDMETLNDVQFHRCLKPENARGTPELHVFADTSLSAYGACAYLLWPTTNGRCVQLVAAKSRVAPLRQVSVPRLELMAALVASRLAKTLHVEMRTKPEVYLWTDSRIVLKWIQSESTTKKIFVAVRIAEIQSVWEENRWRYVPSAKNVADDLSRGLRASQIPQRWFHGPEFLRRPRDEWPAQEIDMDVSDEREEKMSKLRCSGVQKEQNEDQKEPIIDCKRFSSWTKLLRVTAYCLRFVNLLKSRLRGENTSFESIHLELDETKTAERYWIYQAQRLIPNWEQTCANLAPFEDDKVIRVGGRLRHSPLTYDESHPFLLPSSAHVTELILRDVHDRVYHAGAERTLAESRRRVWVIKGRNTVKRIVRDCVICRKLRRMPHTTLMADLPPERLRAYSPPFTTTGVDLFGPFHLKYGRNKKIKAWGAIFTCATVRAVHLEIVENLSTQAFLHALRRFASQHGWPQTILSDNGTSFVGTQRELRKIVVDGREEIKNFSSVNGLKWKFSTPLSPHQGGIYESLIKQVKRALQVAVGEQTLNWNEMSTIFAEIKALLNSRPLSISPDNPDDPQPITPNHFLLGRASISMPQGPFRESNILLKRFEFTQRLVQCFWEKLIREYFPTLMKRAKWISKGRQLQKGDIVLLVDHNCKRGNWKMAKVVDVFCGKDSIVRNVQLKTQNGLYKRSVQQCCLILENVFA